MPNIWIQNFVYQPHIRHIYAQLTLNSIPIKKFIFPKIIDFMNEVLTQFYLIKMSKTNKYREYSNKAIINKVNPEFIGIAHSYSSVKKQRIMSQQLLDARAHQFSTIDKINKSLQRSISKKKQQLKYVQAVRNRYIDDIMHKQKINRMKQQQLQKTRQKNSQQRFNSILKLVKSKQSFKEKKKSEAGETREKLSALNTRRRMQESRMWQSNNSRVKEIQSEKKRINEYCNRFFQNKNKKFIQNYRQLMNKQKNTEQNNKNKMKTLQEKLVIIRQKTSQKQRMLSQLDQSIQSIKASSKSLINSRVRSTRSMTPIDILKTNKDTKSTMQKIQEPKPKIKLIMS